MRLSPEAQRVLGCLIEKALATPQQYPLSVNALRAACNQSTGRDPVAEYDDSEVEAGLRALRDQQLTRTVFARGSRTPKYEHLLGEALSLSEAHLAVLAVLLLRGPQTVGELRTRTDRLHAFADLEEVDAVLETLATHHLGPFAERLPRQPGQKEPRYRHLLDDGDAGHDGDPSEVAIAATESATAPSTPTATDGLDRLRNEISELRAEVARLRDEVAELRSRQAADGRPADQLS